MAQSGHHDHSVLNCPWAESLLVDFLFLYWAATTAVLSKFLYLHLNFVYLPLLPDSKLLFLFNCYFDLYQDQFYTPRFYLDLTVNFQIR